MGQFTNGLPAGLQPSADKGVLYQGNYLDFFNLTGGQWAQQFLPDVYEKEAEIYGDRSINAFLKMVGAEIPSSSDQIIWTEQGRLHTRYVGMFHTAALDTDGATASAALTTVTAGTVIHFTLSSDAGGGQPGPEGNSRTTRTTNEAVNFKTGQTVMIQVEDAGTNRGGSGSIIKGIVTAVDGRGFSVDPYETVTVAGTPTTTTYTALVYGSEFAKGTGNFTEKLDPSYATYENSPIIMKEHYAINGSDTSQIGWVEISGADGGPSGYLWYMKSEHENRLRWENYLEMSMVEGVRRGGTAADFNDLGTFGGTLAAQKPRGTEGFFAALEDRANVYEGFGDEGAGGGALTDFDNVLKQLDKQGSIQENMLYLNRDLALEIDDILAQQSGANAYGGGGASWGVFNNSQDMALNLGFSGFRRGSYDFYKTDWRYLNDWSTRGGFGDIEGVLIPAGTSKVYDGAMGGSVRRPMLHVRYRASETDNRKMKSWITGSVGGAYTTDVDEMRIHYLSERCLITQAANNYVLFKS